MFNITVHMRGVTVVAAVFTSRTNRVGKLKNIRYHNNTELTECRWDR